MNAHVSGSRILIIGASSAIAESVARLYALKGASIFLVGRTHEKLAIIQTDLRARGASQVETLVWDAHDSDQVNEVIAQAWAIWGGIDTALVAHGTLPDQARTEVDIPYALTEFRTNGESVIACMMSLANYFEAQGSGVLAVIGSVAGDRGRASNYLYGTAKAAVASFSSGLRVRLYKKGVHVLLIKPGFVATPMTANLDLPERLTATPQAVAQDIVHAIEQRKDVLYTPRFWFLIMLIIKNIPNFIFKKMSL